MRRDGVMDPVALSAVVAARDLGVALERVRVAHRVYCRGDGGEPPAEVLRLLERRLSNAVVDRALTGAVELPAAAQGQAAEAARAEVPLDGLEDEALLALSRARTLALDVAEMRAVQAHFAELGRAPSALELETLAQTWSEHCKHKTLTGPIDYRELDPQGAELKRERIGNLLKETVFAATKELDLPRCLSVFVDNAGVIRFDDTQGVAIKVETHNHPSAIEPYGGSGTGIGGVIRDILGTGLGARPILNLDVFCVGDLQAEEAPPGTIHPRDLLEGVVAGVRDYGNRMGIPTVCGALVSEPRYVGNPLVFAGTVGMIPNAMVSKAPRPGDWVVAVGGRTGRDGIHGATFSSDALTSESETVSGGAVQIGNPIEEKKLLDVLLEVRDQGWLSAVTDCGAGGFSSAVGEMAEEVGARVDMALAPLKYAGLAPWEVWISEAQERMVLAVPPEHGPSVLAAFAAEDVEAVQLGTFTGDGRLVVTWGDEVVGDLDVTFLHDGLPLQLRPAIFVVHPERAAGGGKDLTHSQALRWILAHPTVCSKEWIIRQYDHEVQGASALKPLVGVASQGPSDGVAVAPVPGSPRGVVMGLGIHPLLGDADPYHMATCVVDEALRNLVAAGGDPDTCGILDNFSWGDCRRPEQLGGIVRAARGLQDAALAFKAPFVSGKDSLNNEYVLPDGTRVAIPPTVLVSAVGLIEDVSGLVSMDAKGPGHAVYLVGPTRGALLGSLYAAVTGLEGGEAPRVDLERAPGWLRRVHGAVTSGAVLAAHDLSEGGLAVAAAEMAFAGGVGIDLDLDAVPLAEGVDALSERESLFSESPSRFLLEVAPGQEARLSELLGDVPHARVGTTVEATRLQVRRGGGQTVLDEPLAELEAMWRGTLPALYG
jgi:phosphoribosylformylglycinamidine synthase